jgi:hypothetical protein
LKKWVIRLAIIFIIGIPIYAIYDFLDVELDELSEGEFLSKYLSPNHDYTARAYLIDEGGATVRSAIRVNSSWSFKYK